MAVIDTVYSPEGKPISVVDQASTGFNALNAEEFLKLLVVQLQNQDPSEPVSNEALLGQISQMRNLQASIDLEETLDTLTKSQTSAASASFVSSAASLIGRQVTATVKDPLSGEDKTIQGEVTRAILKDGKAYVGIGEDEVPIENITKVSNEAISSVEEEEVLVE